MKTEFDGHHPRSELRAFVYFYGTVIAFGVVLFQFANLLLPEELMYENKAFVATLSFLVSCGASAWVFEVFHRRHLI